MATTDPVRVIIELVDNVSTELKKIQANMEKLDKKTIDPNFEIDDDGEISRIEARMKLLSRRITADWNLDISEGDVAKAVGIRQALQGDIAPGVGVGSATGSGAVTSMRAAPWDMGGNIRKRQQRKAINIINDSFRNLGRTLNKYKPSIMDWWQVLALLIPIMITLGAAVVGVVAALGSLAVAAGAIVGIGLLGWGDSASETMQNLRQEMQMLRREMFAAMQPAASEFQPIAQEWIRGLPNQVARLNDELRGLTTFQSGLEAAGGGLIEWAENALDAITRLQEQAIQVGLRLGGALGSFTIDLLSFGLQELYENQESYIKLAEAFVDIVTVLFNLSKAITFALAQFKPLLDIIVGLTGWMGNKFVTAVLTLTIGLTGLAFVLSNVMAAMLGIKGLGMLSFISNMISKVAYLTGVMWGLFSSLGAVQKAIAAIAATTGVGLLLAAAGQAVMTVGGPQRGAPGTGATGGGTNITNVNIEGNVGNKEMHRLLDHLETNG